MAKVKIQGHASGTGILTVTAPNTSTDRTITLPDATGTLLNSDGSGASLTGLFNPDGAVTINDTGADVDFRVESDTNANALFVQGSDGAVFIGMASKTETISTQAAAYFAPTGSDNEYATLFIVHNSAQKHGIVFKDMNTGGGTQLDFRNSVAAQVGSIYTNASATTFATSSDYRLKENVDYTWDATTRLKQLKPARFNFISDDTNTLVDGFIAHEVSGIVPEAIIGTKDGMTATILYTAEDEETQGDSPTKSVGDVKEASKPAHQGIDQSKLVPLLVKTIQELEARITALEA
jgi:hypothetical protein